MHSLAKLHAIGGNHAVSVMLGGGIPLSREMRDEFENRFGADFSDVRIHNSTSAHASAAAMRANAYTLGSDIVFGANRFAPQSPSGKRLLVHELAHVVQQRRGGAAPALRSNAAHEHGADAAASAYAAGQGAIAVQGSTGVGVARDEEKKSESATDAFVEMAKKRMRRALIDSLIGSLGLPPTGTRLAMQAGMGMADEIADELIKQHKAEQLLKHLRDFAAADIPQFYKGYLIGIVEGLVSPVTDLWGIVVFGERIDRMVKDLLASIFNSNNQIGTELQAVLEAAGKLQTELDNFWKNVREHPQDALLALLNAPDALSEYAENKAYELGKAGGASIVAGLESPWKKKEEEKSAPSFLDLPAAAIAHYAEAAEEYLVDTPWAKIGNKIGYAIGFVAIQAIMIALSYGVGNLIEEAGVALGKIGGAIGKVLEGAGAVVTRVGEFIGTVGKGLAAVEEAIAFLIGKALKPLEKFLKPLLEPLGELFSKLQKLLRKLLGVAEKDGAALVDSAASKAAKRVGEEKVLPKPPPGTPPEVKPALKPKVDTPPTTGGTSVEGGAEKTLRKPGDHGPDPKFEAKKPTPMEKPTGKEPQAKKPALTDKPTGKEPQAKKPTLTDKPTGKEPQAKKPKPTEKPTGKEPKAKKPTPTEKPTGKEPKAKKPTPTKKPTAKPKGPPPPKKQPVIEDPHGMRPDATNFDRQTAGTGGIKKISFGKDPEGRFSVKIKGELQEGLYRGKGKPPAGKTKAPNYNRSRKLISNKEAGLPAGDWENAHLWGPGFGDEAAAGMMKAPRSVNQWYQNEGIEGWMRDVRKAAPPGSKIEVEATAVAWDLEKGGWKPKAQADFLKRAEYRVKVTTPGGEHASMHVTIDVPHPPATGPISIFTDPPGAANPADLLNIIKGTKKGTP